MPHLLISLQSTIELYRMTRGYDGMITRRKRQVGLLPIVREIRRDMDELQVCGDRFSSEQSR